MSKWLVIGVLGFSGFALAQDSVTITGTVVQAIQPSIPMQEHRVLSARSAAPYSPKPITLLKLKLTSRARKTLARRITAETHSPKATLFFGHYPRQVQLGMNDVPVLEQGMYGTCTLFAITAGLDAALGKGDYISQLCQLDLSRYLNAHTYSASGWNGGWGDELYEHLMMFGIVPKSMQETGACAGRKEYPVMGAEEIRDELSVFDYHQMSESILAQGILIVPLIHAEQVNSEVFNRGQLLYTIKGILHHGDRVTASFLLYSAGAPFGSHHVSNDSWILRPEMAEIAQQDEYALGHTLVITGYDDDAIAVDHTGRIHRGLLTLRNSWGSAVGDHGDFYMTYAYFKAAVLEAHQIRLNLKSSE